MTDGKRAFLDTNIILRLLNEGLPFHSEIKEQVEGLRSDEFELWISRQIIREYLVQVSRPGFLAEPLSIEQITSHAAALKTLFKIADDTEAVTDRLIELMREFPTGGKQIHDANIVATMLVYDIRTLLTLNVDDLRRFSSKIRVLTLMGT